MSPHSFVLADLFDVNALELTAPDHVIEADTSFEWTVCPDCDGQEWVEVECSAYAKSARAWGRPDLARGYKPCLRCNQQGEVLDLPLEPVEVSTAELVETIANLSPAIRSALNEMPLLKAA